MDNESKRSHTHTHTHTSLNRENDKVKRLNFSAKYNKIHYIWLSSKRKTSKQLYQSRWNLRESTGHQPVRLIQLSAPPKRTEVVVHSFEIQHKRNSASSKRFSFVTRKTPMSAEIKRTSKIQNFSLPYRTKKSPKNKHSLISSWTVGRCCPFSCNSTLWETKEIKRIK